MYFNRPHALLRGAFITFLLTGCRPTPTTSQTRTQRPNAPFALQAAVRPGPIVSTIGRSGLVSPGAIWSRGYFDLVRFYNPQIPLSYFSARTEDRISAEDMRFQWQNLKGWLWVRSGSHKHKSNDIATFAHAVLPSITEPILLITSDGDTSIPSELPPGTAEAILNHRHLVHWFTQNYDGTLTHPKLSPIPIGFDLHTRQDPDIVLELLHTTLHKAVPAPSRHHRILMDVANKSHPERQRVEALLSPLEHVAVLPQHVSLAEVQALYASYRFVLSPRGNGMDCHRTWEVLALGSIPIVRSSALDPLYKGLPVVIVNDWDELTRPTNLDRWWEELAPLLMEQPLAHLRRRRWLAPPLEGRPIALSPHPLDIL